jgi:multiple sugar transport system substrate-binding protein
MTFVGWSHTEPGSREPLEATFAAFRAANPGIRLELVGVPFGQMETTLVLRRRTNQRTDVAQMQERWLPVFAAIGGLVDADTVLGREFITTTFAPEAVAMGEINGRRLGVPWAFGTTGMVANGKVMAEAGIAEPPRTMAEFLEALRRIKRWRPASSPFGFSTRDASLAQLEAQIFFWQFGARFFDEQGAVAIDSPEARRALQFLADLVHEGLVLPGNDRFDTRRLFGQELVGFYIDAPVARAFARAQSGQGEAYDRYVVPMAMPVVNAGDTPRAVQWAHFLVMYDHGGARPTADGPAAHLIRYLTQPEVQIAYYRAAGVFPTNRAALTQLHDDAYLTRWVALSGNALRDEPSNFSNSADLRRIIGEEVIAAMLGQKTADAAITSMATRLRAAPPRR